MGLNAGDLNRRIQIRRATSVPDGLGGETETWADLGSPIAAMRRDVSDGERLSAAAWDNKLVTRFTVRSSAFSKGIKRTDRLTHEGITYVIDGIKEVPGRRAFLEITAVTGEVE